MDYLPPFVVHGSHMITSDQLGAHARDYRRVLEGLRDGTLDIAAARRRPRLNWQLDDLFPGKDD